MTQRQRLLRLGALLATLIAFGTATVGCEEKAYIGENPSPLANRFEQVDRVEIFSLDPSTHLPPSEGFHGITIRGSTVVADPAERSALLTICHHQARDLEGFGFGCLLRPHHGIRVTRGDVTTDFVICFRCVTTEVYENDTRLPDIMVGRGAERALDDALKSAGVPYSDED